ncbi:MAG TPA: ribose 5-phosphate isomerase B [Spirochaetota bacterium]|nr:ribose 5-phosphate isomerase B [Spirochaetota bacterium]HPJ37899.1 ribose 5-phosphate isomerase B [Spirochaetota bacterium]HPQ52988.1 ribose 5-phosphate isomerase B [Spirochaetota bacterium]
MKIVIGSDHAGLQLKKEIISSIKNIEFIDVGTDSEESCDYPDYIAKVAEAVQQGKADGGIAICGTGIGASLVANKFTSVRAALCFNEFMAEMSKRHNNANVLALGARVIGVDLALRIVERWLETPFDGGRHQRRLDKLASYER